MADNKAYKPFKMVSLNNEAMTLGEYVESVFLGDDKPAAIIMSEANKAVMTDLPSRDVLLSTDKSVNQLELEAEAMEHISSGIVISSDASFDDDTLLLTYAKKPATQGISSASIMDELGKLVEGIAK